MKIARYQMDRYCTLIERNNAIQTKSQVTFFDLYIYYFEFYIKSLLHFNQVFVQLIRCSKKQILSKLICVFQTSEKSGSSMQYQEILMGYAVLATGTLVSQIIYTGHY